tara:strand:+ start:126 stop:602 length:477 start_codon:yes stop_codon:yes gene_type:complete
MIEKIEVTFDFGKLLKNLDKFLQKDIDIRKNALVKAAKDELMNGKFFPIKKSTENIRKRGLSRKLGKGEYGNKPLMHTGDMFKSIKAVKDGVTYISYGTPSEPNVHQKTHKVASSAFSRKFKTVNKNVPKRDFMSKALARVAKLKTDFYEELNKALTK